MNRIKELRLKKGIKQSTLSQLLNVKQATISGYETDTRQPDNETLKILANYFEVSIDYLLGNDNTLLHKAAQEALNYQANQMTLRDILRLPILGVIRAGQPILAIENIEGYYPIDRQFLNSNCEYFYMRVVGDSMNQKLCEGCLVLIQKQEYLDNGDIGVVLVDGLDATIKKFHKQGNLITLIPMSNNPEHQIQLYDATKIDIKIIGKAIHVITEL